VSERPHIGVPSDGGSHPRREPENSLLYRIVAAEVDALREDLAAASPYPTLKNTSAEKAHIPL